MSAVDDKINKATPSQRVELERVRSIIKETVPEAEEVISYGMPAFKYKKKYLIAYEAFKDHLSIFPGSEAIADNQEKLKKYKTFKGTVQFTEDKPLPEPLIKAIVLHRVENINKNTK